MWFIGRGFCVFVDVRTRWMLCFILLHILELYFFLFFFFLRNPDLMKMTPTTTTPNEPLCDKRNKIGEKMCFIILVYGFVWSPSKCETAWKTMHSIRIDGDRFKSWSIFHGWPSTFAHFIWFMLLLLSSLVLLRLPCFSVFWLWMVMVMVIEFIGSMNDSWSMISYFRLMY